MNHITKFSTPQLEKLHSGKVRESFRINKETRMIVVTDRISAFDKVLKSAIPCKGAVLNSLSNFWFEKTKNIIDNHFITSPDPNITIVKEASPIRIEMVVRGYLTGSMWRYYQKGKRNFSGIEVPDGMKKNQRFDKPIITPTTKEESDREITPSEIIKGGYVSKDIYEQMEKSAMELFDFGTRFLADKDLILVDTKYEFGLIDGKLTLIDEIHTPDSSRFWKISAYNNDPENVDAFDKEYVRLWLLNNQINGQYPDTLPEDVIEETTKRYIELYNLITDKSIQKEDDVRTRIYKNLVKAGIIKDGYIAIVMGSPNDIEHCNKIKSYIEQYDIMIDMRVVSAHKNGEEIVKIADEYNYSIEPGAVIAVAGRSNGLGGALSANLNIPVFNCPPFKDNVDMMININSSLMMPSKIPCATIIDIESSALAALRSLNIYRLRDIFKKEIDEMKLSLKESDKKIRGR